MIKISYFTQDCQILRHLKLCLVTCNQKQKDWRIGFNALINNKEWLEKGPTRKLNVENELFAVLVHVKLDLFKNDMANRIGTYVSKIIYNVNIWIILAFRALELELLFPYPLL